MSFEPGAYEQLVTDDLANALSALQVESLVAALEPAEAAEILARHIAAAARAALGVARDSDGVTRQVRHANRILEAIGLGASVDPHPRVTEPGEMLQAVGSPNALPGSFPPVRPETPFATSALLVNGTNQPNIGNEVKKELASADRVDLLCAFIKWEGVRVIENQLRSFIERGKEIRVITTTYIGASDRRAIDRLVELGAKVRISYETRMTRLHAKAWLFHRNSGFSTGYVGSSNLSKTAMLDGLEWNVRISAVEQPHLLDTFEATFEQYWNDPDFEAYDSSDESQRERLDRALTEERGGTHLSQTTQLTGLDVNPYGYQREILEALAAEREVHGSWRNLVVMATGTGKTVVAGLDYRRLRQLGAVESLLFVAHRDRILEQSRSTFRHILRDGDFGEMLVGGNYPQDWKQVFASVQSLGARIDQFAPDRFDMVIVDEFHHAMAPTYVRLLEHLRPKVLLGLTATPERADGQRVTDWFGGRTAVELRLWEALERNLLAPFQYFGIHDNTDLRGLTWRRGQGYVTSELEAVYTGDDARARIVAQAVQDKVTSIESMRALGFCVSVAHARFMADRFNSYGIASRSLTGKAGDDERRSGIADLVARRINVLFTVDLFNEGVDIPEVDTALFLRPTESATLFMQQLGRGLRLSDEKRCLTVLDFIGAQHADFRFDTRFRALTGETRRGLSHAVEAGFPTLPSGCHIDLDRSVTELVLANLRTSLRLNWRTLTNELLQLGDVSLPTFLAENALEIEDVYRTRNGGWTGLRRRAGFASEIDRSAADVDESLASAFARMLHIDDVERIDFYGSILEQPEPPTMGSFDKRQRRLLTMLHFDVWTWNEEVRNADQKFNELWAHPQRLAELREVLGVLRSRLHRVTPEIPTNPDVPLRVHARYSLSEGLAAFGVENPIAARGSGVRWVEEERADVFFFNLRKTERHFSPTTMYADRAVSPSVFQWESQNATSASSPTGQRYVSQAANGSLAHLFMRESKESDGALGAPAYIYLGPGRYMSHTGDKPMRVLWKLDHDLPADVFHAARVAAG